MKKEIKMYRITLYFKNGQKNWFNGTKTDCKKAMKFLGTIYHKVTIEEK